MNERRILLTGCSCGGKSTLLEALGRLGFATVQEPGRRIIAEEMASNGNALPWVNMTAFARRAIGMAQSDLKMADHSDGLIFFDRGLIDAAIALEHSGGQSVREIIGKTRPYAKRVFLAPPWKEIFVGDSERRHSFDAAVQEYHRIKRVLNHLGYTHIELPKMPIRERVDMVLKECSAF